MYDHIALASFTVVSIFRTESFNYIEPIVRPSIDRHL